MAQNYTENCFAAGNAGLTDLQNMENNFHCLKTNFSGSSAPADSTAGMFWADTTAKYIKIRNSANDDWISVINFSTNTTNGGAVYKVQRTLTAGTGLAGGGVLTTDIEINVASCGITETQIKNNTITLSKIAVTSRPPLGSDGAKVFNTRASSYESIISIPFICPADPSTITARIYKYNPSTVNDLIRLQIYSSAGSLLKTGAEIGSTNSTPKIVTATVDGSTLTENSFYTVILQRTVLATANEYVHGVSFYWT